MAEIELINTSKHVFTDISSEDFREYHYLIGDITIRIKRPQWLAVSESGGHRVLDGDGVSYYIKDGWDYITWKVGKGLPHFVA